MKKLLPIIILLGCLVLPQYPTEWSEDILIAEAQDEHDQYNAGQLVLDNDGNYICTFDAFDYLDWDWEIDYARFSQDGTLIVAPMAVIDNPSVDEGVQTAAIDSRDYIHIFYYHNVGGADSSIYYTKIDLAGNVLKGPELFINTQAGIAPSIRPAIAIEPDDTIHLLYLTDPNDTGLLDQVMGYTRWNPYTGERFEIEGLLPNDPRIDNARFNSSMWSMVVDPDGNAHCVIEARLYYELWGQGEVSSEIIWMRVGEIPEMPIGRILTYLELGNGDEKHPYCTIDASSIIHIVYVGNPNEDQGITDQCCYLSIDTDGNTVTPLRYDFFPEEWEDGNDAFAMHYNNGNLALIEHNQDGDPNGDRYIFGRLDLQGNVIEDFEFITGYIVWCYKIFPSFVHHNNGFIGFLFTTFEHSGSADAYYKYTLTGASADSPKLSARSTEEGLLLSWGSTRADSTWRLTRNDEQLVSLSGRSEYSYLDTTAKPNTTYSFRLIAEFPDGDRQQFAPVEATWQLPLDNRVTLSKPYPCPARDSVTLSYSLPDEATEAELAIYDLAGRLVECFPLAPTSGQQTLSVNTTAYRSGVYLATLQTAAETITQRLVITR